MNTLLQPMAQPPPNGGGMALAASPSSSGINAVRETMETLKAIRTFVKNEMVEGLDFGVIPGTGQKPALLQPGAQKTALYFNATPDHQVEKTELGNGHVEFLISTRLMSRTTGATIGMGLGSCSTMEKKYRYRNGSLVCPECGKPTLFRSKEAGQGYYCWRKKDGCGATFPERHPGIVNQAVGQVENPDIYDARNTVLKMAVKRSFVAAALSLGCLSELFTQDIDETYDIAGGGGQDSPQKNAGERNPSPSAPSDAGRREVNEAFGSAPAPSATKTIKRFEARLSEFCHKVNAAWTDRHMASDGSVPSWVGDLVEGHLLVERMLGTAGIDLRKANYNARMKAASDLWLADEKTTLEIWRSFVKSRADELEAEHPDEGEGDLGDGSVPAGTTSREPGSDG